MKLLDILNEKDQQLWFLHNFNIKEIIKVIYESKSNESCNDESVEETTVHRLYELNIPGFAGNFINDKNLVFAKYQYIYRNNEDTVEGEFEILYNEIYNTMKSLYKFNSLYSFNNKKIRSIIDDIITAKKKQAYLMHYAISNNDEQLIQLMNDAIETIKSQAEDNLLDQYILNLHKDELNNIDYHKYRKELGKEKCYTCIYTIVNSVKIAEGIVGYTEASHLTRTQLPKDAFIKAASKYASIKKINDDTEFVTESELRQIFDNEVLMEINALTDYNRCVKPVKLNIGKYCILFIENVFSREYSDEYILKHVKKELLSQKIEQLTNDLLRDGYNANINENNISTFDNSEVICRLTVDDSEESLTIGELYQLLKFININESQFRDLPSEYKKKILDVLLKVALSNIVRKFLVKQYKLRDVLANEFEGDLRHRINKKFNEIMEDHCKSGILTLSKSKSGDTQANEDLHKADGAHDELQSKIVPITDAQLIEQYPDIVSCKRVDGYAIYCDSKSIFDYVYGQILKKFDSANDMNDKHKYFIGVAKDYTTAATPDISMPMPQINDLSSKWLDAEGHTTNVEDLKSGHIYTATLQGPSFCILLVDRIYPEETNQALMKALRKRRAEEETAKRLLKLSIINENVGLKLPQELKDDQSN